MELPFLPVGESHVWTLEKDVLKCIRKGRMKLADTITIHLESTRRRDTQHRSTPDVTTIACPKPLPSKQAQQQ